MLLIARWIGYGGDTDFQNVLEQNRAACPRRPL